MGKQLLRLLPILCFLALPAAAADWSIGVSSGPFVFGDFVERHLRIGIPPTGVIVTSTLSAKTRAGLSVDLQRRLSNRWSVRAEGTFTRAPLTTGSESVTLDSGQIEVATLALPVIFNINRGGSFRFYLYGGPAYGAYRIERQTNATGSIGTFAGTRAEWGGEAGGGVAWMWSDRFSVEGEIADIVTGSPFREEDLSSARGTNVLTPHNVHTKLGIRYRF